MNNDPQLSYFAVNTKQDREKEENLRANNRPALFECN